MLATAKGMLLSQNATHSRSCGWALSCVMWLLGCRDPRTEVHEPDSASDANIEDCGDKEPAPESLVDDLGRLLTAPGLCHIEGGLTGQVTGQHVELELSYDATSPALSRSPLDFYGHLMATMLGHQNQKPRRTGFSWSGRRDSNSRHSAWEADALPTELLPLAAEQPTTAPNLGQVITASTVVHSRTTR
jgi:hypothetical protein